MPSVRSLVALPEQFASAESERQLVVAEFPALVAPAMPKFVAATSALAELSVVVVKSVVELLVVEAVAATLVDQVVLVTAL